MTTYLCFGIAAQDLDAARARVESLFGLKMNLRDSEHRGGLYYLAGRSPGENFMLVTNFNEFDEEWTEPSCTECGFVLFVNSTERADEICRTLYGTATLIWGEELNN